MSHAFIGMRIIMFLANISTFTGILMQIMFFWRFLEVKVREQPE